MAAVSTAATALTQASATAITPTNAQASAQQSFKDVTKTIQDAFAQDQFKTTITLDQGSVVRIYVNKDYKFPKDAILKISR